MKETKFTEGKWLIADGTKVGDQILFIHSEVSGVICRLTKYVANTPLTKEDIANAHIIAAAPEMYAMLKHISDFQTDNENIQKSINQLLAKARGEA